ncbi:MAG: CsbD family protein [Gaiellaceae bacterium]
MTNRDTAKGRVKKAAGDLTGDKELHREGAVDEAAGKAKRAVDAAADKAKNALRRR